MKIGILGGTFDPIHRGHLALARFAKRQFKLDQILFVLSARPPHKKNLRILTPIKHRLAMVRLAIGNKRGFKISDIEARRKGLSYTVDTLKEIKRKYPTATLFLILGQDSYSELDRWRRPGEIREMAHLLVARRPGGPKLRKHRSRVSWIKMPLYFIASTNLRKSPVSGEAFAKSLPPSVVRYIKSHRLYRCSV